MRHQPRSARAELTTAGLNFMKAAMIAAVSEGGISIFSPDSEDGGAAVWRPELTWEGWLLVWSAAPPGGGVAAAVFGGAVSPPFAVPVWRAPREPVEPLGRPPRPLDRTGLGFKIAFKPAGDFLYISI